MQRKFILNLALIILVNLLIKPFYIFGVERGIQNVVGTSNYGLYYALFNLSFMFSLIIDPGITNFNNKHIAQDRSRLTAYFSNIHILKLLLSVLFIIILFVYAFISKFNSVEMYILSILMLGQIFNSFVLYNRSNLAGLHLFKTDTLISVMDKLLMIVLCAPFIYISDLRTYLSIPFFVIIQCLSFLLTAVASFWFVRKHTINLEWKFDKQASLEIIKKSLPFTILAGLMFIYTKADTIIIKELFYNGNEEVGIYAAAYRLIDALNMIAVLFAGLLYPMFSRMIQHNDNIEPLVKTAFSLLVIPACLGATLFYLYSNQVMELLYYEHTNESALVFSILGISFIGICNTYVFGTLLTANGNISLLNKIALLGVIINLSLNLYFTPQYGVKSAAVISCITFTTVSLLHTYYSFKKFKFRLQYSYILRATVSAISIFMLIYLNLGSEFAWIYQAVLIGLLSIIILIITRLIPINEMIKVLKTE